VDLFGLWWRLVACREQIRKARHLRSLKREEHA
jgi:hypothetical protein